MSKVENLQQRIADAISATGTRPARTVSLPDGYNGHTILFYADPVAVDGDTVRLRCAEPGKDYMFAWRAARDVKAALEAQGDEVMIFDKKALYARTVATQHQLKERYPELRTGLLDEGFEYDSAIGAFQRNGVRVYYNEGAPDIQYRLDLLMPYSRFTVKTTDTVAVVIDDRLDMEPAQILDQILRTVDDSHEAQTRVDEAVTAPSRLGLPAVAEQHSGVPAAPEDNRNLQQNNPGAASAQEPADPSAIVIKHGRTDNTLYGPYFVMLMRGERVSASVAGIRTEEACQERAEEYARLYGAPIVTTLSASKDTPPVDAPKPEAEAVRPRMRA